MPDLDDIVGELIGNIPVLPPVHAERLANRAWQKVRDYRMWSWQMISGAQLFLPNQVTTGSVNVVYGDPLVTVDGVAAAALNAVPALITPVASPVVGKGMQFRAYFTNSAVVNAGEQGPYYNIVEWDRVGTLRLDRPYGENTANSIPYTVLKVYFTAPAYPSTAMLSYNPDFFRWESVTNLSSGYTVRGRRLNYTQGILNAIDPQRGATQDAYIFAYWGRNIEGYPVWEFYPAPTYQTTYAVSYWSRWPDLSDTQDLPKTSYALKDCVIVMAQFWADQWALRNVQVYPALQSTNWVASMNVSKNEFRELLMGCTRNDDQVQPLMPTRQNRGSDLPLGGAFLQNHDLSSLLGS